MTDRPFRPFDTATVNIAATTSSTNVALNRGGLTEGDCRVYNAGPDTAFINFGGSSVTAAATNIPIPLGAVEVFNVAGATHAAAVAAPATATVYFTVGKGP